MTRHCTNHSLWLGLSSQEGEVTLTKTDLAENLLFDLPHSQSQAPSLFVLVGNRTKAAALKELVSVSVEKKSTSTERESEIHLHLDPSTAFSDRPILIAGGDFPTHQRSSKVVPAKDCRETTHAILPRLRNGIAGTALLKASDNLYFRLLSPFTDVFCFFAVDLGGLKSIACRISSWLEMSQQPSTLKPGTHPQIIIVLEPASQHLELRGLEDFLRLLHEETDKNIFAQFSRIRVVSLLPDGHVSEQARYRRLREHLMSASDQVRLARLQSSTLFSAQHFAALLQQASSHFVGGHGAPFDFVRASRLQHPPAIDLKEHWVTFLSKIRSLEELEGLAIPLIASSILLDHYPPDMHLFDPSDVFHVLYKDTCYQSWKASGVAQKFLPHLLPTGFVKKVEDALTRLFEEMNQRATSTAADIHRLLLCRSDLGWLSLRSDDTCLVCLRRRPQYGLPCGHCICDNCIRVFGRKNQHDPWLFEVDSCFFCGVSASEVDVKILPPTAGVRVLTFDGGGVRGLVTLQYMQILQERIGLPYPVQDNFDVAYGTSSGGIIVLALFVNGWSVERCMECFERLSRLAFQPRLIARIPIFSTILDVLISYFADGRYPVENLEAALQDAFGSKRSILDCSKATATGARVGFPVTTIHETSTCIFTNYNAVGTRPRKSGKLNLWFGSEFLTGAGYHVLRPKDGFGRVPLWEIARCGSAAPSYFKPKYIAGLGTFQDGGIRQNDPGNLALQEVAAIYPGASEPSLVVSLGTGSRREDDEPRMARSRGIWRDGFIPRLLRAFTLSMSSTILHTYRSRQKQGSKEQYFRFDLEFDGLEPALDDTTKMQQLKDSARVAICASKDLDRLARCVIAELFIFELAAVPKKANGRYLCEGYLACRLRADKPAFKVLWEQLLKISAKFLVQGVPLTGSLNDGSYLEKGNLHKRIFFELPDKKSPVSIQLREGSFDPCAISGSPFSIDGLVTAQHLGDFFGRADHVKRKTADTLEIISRKRPRLSLLPFGLE